MNPTPPTTPPIVLVFAGSDPTCGAGLQADALTLAALGCHPLTVVTALTAQDTVGVHDVWPIESDRVERQAQVLLADIPVAAIKVGMIASSANAQAIRRIADAHPAVPMIVDPVLASGRGDALASEALVQTIQRSILPRTLLVTPNTLEARRLAGSDNLALDQCAYRLLDGGCQAVLITGTHDDTPRVVNTLYDRRGVVRADEWPRLPASYHGSGCTLAAAVTAHIARGHPLEAAIYAAQRFTWRSLADGFRAGAGQLLPNRRSERHDE